MLIRHRPPWWFFVFRKARPDPDDREWRRLRAYVLRRDRRRCQIKRWSGWGPRCGRFATVVDHIWPLTWGGTSDPENLQAACEPCNTSKGGSLPLAAVPHVAAMMAGVLVWILAGGMIVGYVWAAHDWGLGVVTTALWQAWAAR